MHPSPSRTQTEVKHWQERQCLATQACGPSMSRVRPWALRWEGQWTRRVLASMGAAVLADGKPVVFSPPAPGLVHTFSKIVWSVHPQDMHTCNL